MSASTATAFSAEQLDHIYPDGSQNHYWPQARHRILRRQLRTLLREDPAGFVLDIGCGRGLMVDYLRRQGIAAYGCDLARATAITPGVAPYLHFNTQAFSLEKELRDAARILLLLDVLEHIAEPSAFLSRCHEAFPRCRHVLVTLPARMEIWSSYDVYNGHYLRYDDESVGKIIPRDCWRLVHQGYFFHFLYPPARVMALLRIDRSTRTRIPGPRQIWVHRLLGAYFDWEERVVPGAWRGTSLYALLKRV